MNWVGRPSGDRGIGWENDAVVSFEFNIGKSYGENKKDKVSRLRVRQFWREKGL